MTYWADALTYNELKAKGTKFYETFLRDGDMKTEYWECDNGYYVYTIHYNTRIYTGETAVHYLGNIESARKAGFYCDLIDAQRACEAYDRMIAERESKDSPESKFKTARLAAGLTRQQLADASGVDMETIEEIENGMVLIDGIEFKTGLNLAKALEISPYDLQGKNRSEKS